MTNNCGTCGYWARNKKRNVSLPDQPLYYAECKFPIDSLGLPYCVSIEDVSENNGVNCPRYVAMTDGESK